jgi:hypothetical protein
MFSEWRGHNGFPKVGHLKSSNSPLRWFSGPTTYVGWWDNDIRRRRSKN